LVRPLVVVAVDEVVELGLLLQEVAARWFGGLELKGLGRVKTLYRKSLGRAGLNASWFSGFDYARIAAINGWMPMMFITRVRL
jgi:hypothetical protein